MIKLKVNVGKRNVLVLNDELYDNFPSHAVMNTSKTAVSPEHQTLEL